MCFEGCATPRRQRAIASVSSFMTLKDLDTLLDLVTTATTPLPLATAAYISMVAGCASNCASKARQLLALVLRRLPGVNAALKRPSFVTAAAALQPQVHCLMLNVVYTAITEDPAAAASALSECGRLLEACTADAVAWTVSQPQAGEGTSVYSVWKLAALLEAAVRQPVSRALIHWR